MRRINPKMEPYMEMGTLHYEISELVHGRVKQINRNRTIERKTWTVPIGSWDVAVMRGKVVEKATTTRITLATKHPETGEDTRFNVFQVMVYPASPKIPILLINVENRVGREDIFAGFLDVAAVAAVKADLRMLQNRIRALAEDHNKKYERLRSKLTNMYCRDRSDKPVNAGIGLRLDLKDRDYDLVRDCTLCWIESYFEIVEKRRKDNFTGRQELVMNQVRARIMEFYLLKDISFKVALQVGVPLEALSLGNFAPCIRY
jgi:coproporphyrinogen III oxidase